MQSLSGKKMPSTIMSAEQPSASQEVLLKIIFSPECNKYGRQRIWKAIESLESHIQFSVISDETETLKTALFYIIMTSVSRFYICGLVL